MGIANKVTFTVGAEVDDERTVQIGLKTAANRGLGNANATVVGVYLSSDAIGLEPKSANEVSVVLTAPGEGVSLATGGNIPIDDRLLWFATSLEGVLDLKLFGDFDVETSPYVNVILPSGKVVTSSAVVFADDPEPLEIGVGYDPDNDLLVITRLSGDTDLQTITSVTGTIGISNFSRSAPDIQPIDAATINIADASTILATGELTALSVRIAGVVQASWTGSIDVTPTPAPDLEIGIGYNPSTDTLVLSRLDGTYDMGLVDELNAVVEGVNYNLNNSAFQNVTEASIEVPIAATSWLGVGELTSLSLETSNVVVTEWTGSQQLLPEYPLGITSVVYDDGTDSVIITTDAPYPTGLDGVYYLRDAAYATLNAGQFVETDATTITIPSASVEPGEGELKQIRLLDDGYQVIAIWTGSEIIDAP